MRAVSLRTPVGGRATGARLHPVARRVVASVFVCLSVASGGGAFAANVVLDDFEALSGWTTTASEGARVSLAQEEGRSGMGMRIAFELGEGPGFVVVRKEFALPLPENYAFTFDLRGDARPNGFEFKLLDGARRNVWWRRQQDFVFPREWQRVTVRKSRFDFAFGPAAGGKPKSVGAIEFAIAGRGGSGSIWIDDLALEEREPAEHDGAPPAASASSAQPGNEAGLVLDRDPATRWRSEPLPREQWVVLDFTKNLEHGGLIIDWDPDDYARTYEVQVSNDGAAWTSVYRTETGRGSRDYVYMPDAESRYIRVDMRRSSRGRGYGIASLSVQPFAFSASPTSFFEAIARDAPAGTYPKYLAPRQTYWTVVGVDGDDKEALLNEEGMLEVDQGAFSIEPFLYTDDGLITWDTVTTTQGLEDGYLPIPSVTWLHDRLSLTITAFAAGPPGRSTLYARYRIVNRRDQGEPVQLFLAIRPFQVNPPWQTLNTTGGVSRIQEMRLDGRAVWVDRERAVVSLTLLDQFGAATFEGRSITEFLANGKVPADREVSDPFGFASGALQYNLYLRPNGETEVAVAVPFHAPQDTPVMGVDPENASTFVAHQLDETRRAWEQVLGRVEVKLPPQAERIERSLKSTLAYILINRDPPAIQPGSRNYARSWIRDGAFTSTALLEMGFTEEVREFLRWFAGHQGADGKIPCCVDRAGADPVPEHDSAGAFVFAVAEYYRFTRDVGFLVDLWPRVARAIEYMASLRQKRLTEEFRSPDKLALYGLLPESISHEGYSSYPVHSYWDDFFALRGFKDAAALAAVVGDEERAAKFAALRDDFRKTLYASIAHTVAERGIDYIPGSVEHADFDPTSTAIALVPGGELEGLPGPELARTFDRYYAEFEARRSGEREWTEYSPYELRNVSALVRLGQKERALTLLEYVMGDQRPAGWNEWAEIVWRDPAVPRFIGDMPHTWVGAGFIHAVRSMLAYERESDRALVLAAGIPAAWVMSEEGVGVRRLPTHYGILNYTLRGEGADTVRLRVSGDLARIPGSIVVVSPLDRPIKGVSVNGEAITTFTDTNAVIKSFPADVVLTYQ